MIDWTLLNTLYACHQEKMLATVDKELVDDAKFLAKKKYVRVYGRIGDKDCTLEISRIGMDALVKHNRRVKK